MMMKNQHPFHLIPPFSFTVVPYPRVWPKQMVIAAIHGGMALRRMCKLPFVRF